MPKSSYQKIEEMNKSKEKKMQKKEHWIWEVARWAVVVVFTVVLYKIVMGG